MKKKKKKVIIALSGGVDSSVAAALLKRAEVDLIGVFMRLVDVPRFQQGEKLARKVAKSLKIPFLVLDFRKEFKKKIIDYFLKEYKKGLTPNPCVVCNKEIKFGLLKKNFPGDFIATGHYARLRRGKLYKGKDKEKDQSYFLWQLRQKQLRRILFPVGQYTKEEVKSLAKEFKLPVLKIQESQEICFILRDINNFLRKHLKLKPGLIVEKSHYGASKIIGGHEGLYFYTIGQRKGIGLPGGPYFVLDKNLKKNLLIVTKNERDLYKKELTAKKVNWISGKKPRLPLKIKAKIRYRHKKALATLKSSTGKNIKVIFDKPQRAITPGQSVVFYLPAGSQIKGEELVGGGIIC